MSKLLLKPKNFQNISVLSTVHECKLARDLWSGLNSLVKGVGENYSLLVLDFVKSRQAGLIGEMGEKKPHPLLKTELINYQQKLAHELRESARCTSAHFCTSSQHSSTYPFLWKDRDYP